MKQRKFWLILPVILFLGLSSAGIYMYYKFSSSFSGYTSPRTVLTSREQDYLNKNEPIKVGIDKGFSPFEFVNNEGEVRGLTVDYLKLMALKLNLEFKFIPGTWHDCIQWLKNDKIDLLNNVTPTDKRSRFLDYTRSIFDHTSSIYVLDEVVDVSNLYDLKGHRVGMKKSSSIIGKVSAREGIEIVRYPTSARLLKALRDREVGAVIDYDYAFQRILFKQKAEDVKRVGDYVGKEKGTFAVHKGDEVLLSILGKGINQISKPEKQELIRKWLGSEFEQKFSLVGLFERYYPWLLGIAGLILFLAGWNFFLQQRIQAQTRELRSSEKRYRHLFNDSPISLWEEDFSGVVKYVEKKKDEGIEDFSEYLKQHPEELKKVTRRLEVIDVNQRTLQLYEASGKEEFFEKFQKMLPKEAYPALRKQVVAIAEQKTNFETETVNLTLAGERKDIYIKWLVPDRPQKKYSRVFVAIVDISRRKEIERALEESLEEKEVLLQEVHHRVKNNLFTIISLLEMQLEQIDDVKANELLRQSVNRIHTMALIHQKIYAEEKFAELDFGVYLEELVEDLKESTLGIDQQVEIEYNLDFASLEPDSLIPCALSVNELVTNAFSHGFTDRKSGKVKIVFKANNGQYRIRVMDNGTGIGQDFSLDRSASLGLTLVSRLVEKQLQGELTYRNNDWTVFEITFPATG